jgi:hypothetical protein
MLTVLTSGDREDVKEKLRSSPLSQHDAPVILKMVITWVISIITSFLNYISHFIGVISDDIATLTERVVELEENTLHMAPATQLVTPTPSKQPPHPSNQTRCKCCHALGHATIKCQSKNLVVVKKHVSHNQKSRKKQEVSPLPSALASYIERPLFPHPPTLFADITPHTSGTSCRCERVEEVQGTINAGQTPRRCTSTRHQLVPTCIA